MKVNYAFYGKFHLSGLSTPSVSLLFDRVKDELQVGTELYFQRDLNCSTDPYAIWVYYKGYKIGYVEKKKLLVNRKYARLLDAGLTELFYVTVGAINYKQDYSYPYAPAEKWVEVNVYLRLDGTRYFSLTPEEERMIDVVRTIDLSRILRAFPTDMNTLGKLLEDKRVDAAFTVKWELKDILAAHGKADALPIGTCHDEDDQIGEYFTSYNGKVSGMDEKLIDYPLICVYLNRIDRLAAGNEQLRMWMICSTFIHECMHALFDHKPDTLCHPHDSYLEEPTCECGTIMIAKELERQHPEYVGFGDWAFDCVDSKKNKYGLGADLFRYWPGSGECQGDNAVDAYDQACDFIELINGQAVSWTGRVCHTVAIPEMLEIYRQARRKHVSNQMNKV